MLSMATSCGLAVGIFLIVSVDLCGYAAARDLYEGYSCQMKDSTAGICTKLTECKSIDEALQRRAFPFRDLVRCSFIDDIEVICCPDKRVERTLGARKLTILIPDSGNGNGIVLKPLSISPQPTPGISLSGRKSDKACAQFTEVYIKAVDFHILEGEPTFLGEFPHMAALGYPSLKAGNDYDWKCGGTLISNRYVMTAAHCVSRPEFWPELVRLGTIYLNESGIDLGVEDIILHPDYRGSLQYHDIALIRLNSTVKFTSYIFPACLSSDRSDSNGRELVATGWGAVSTRTLQRSGLLLKVKLRTVDLRQCNQRHVSLSRNRRMPNGLNDGQICAGDFTRLKRGDTCEGDSGGPLQSISATELAKIVGITSFGEFCGTDIPGVYAKVPFYLDWIESTVWPDAI